MDEPLHDLLAPRLQRPLAEPTREALDACEADAVHLYEFAVQHVDARIGEDPRDGVRLTGLEVVVAEDRHDRDPDPGGQ